MTKTIENTFFRSKNKPNSSHKCLIIRENHYQLSKGQNIGHFVNQHIGKFSKTQLLGQKRPSNNTYAFTA